MYDVADQFPLLETDPVKDSNDARQIEKYLASTGLPYTFFRPQVSHRDSLVDKRGRRSRVDKEGGGRMWAPVCLLIECIECIWPPAYSLVNVFWPRPCASFPLLPLDDALCSTSTAR